MAWITLFISVIGNIINIINSREKFKALNDAFHDLRKKRVEKKAGINFIRKIDPLGDINLSAIARSFLIYFFLLAITSSSVLSLYIGHVPDGISLANYAWMIYFYSSVITNLIYLFMIKDMGCSSYVLLISITVILGNLWGMLTNWILGFGISLFYSGCIAGLSITIIMALLTIKTWTADWRI